MTADVVPRMEAASPALNLPSAAKLRPSPAVPGSMESAIKMWLQVGNVQKLQQVSPIIEVMYQELLGVTKADCFLNNKSMLTRLEGCTFKDRFCVLGTFLALLEKFKKNMVDENNIKFNEIRVISLSISISFNLQK